MLDWMSSSLPTPGDDDAQDVWVCPDYEMNGWDNIRRKRTKVWLRALAADFFASSFEDISNHRSDVIGYATIHSLSRRLGKADRTVGSFEYY